MFRAEPCKARTVEVEKARVEYAGAREDEEDEKLVAASRRRCGVDVDADAWHVVAALLQVLGSRDWICVWPEAAGVALAKAERSIFLGSGDLGARGKAVPAVGSLQQIRSGTSRGENLSDLGWNGIVRANATGNGGGDLRTTSGSSQCNRSSGRPCKQKKGDQTLGLRHFLRVHRA